LIEASPSGFYAPWHVDGAQPSEAIRGLQLASLDAVAIAIAETNVELSPDHTLFGSSEIPAKSLAPILTHPEPLMEAVSEIVLGVRVAGRRRDSERPHRDEPQRFQQLFFPDGIPFD
jgi:hypothetical protein